MNRSSNPGKLSIHICVLVHIIEFIKTNFADIIHKNIVQQKRATALKYIANAKNEHTNFERKKIKTNNSMPGLHPDQIESEKNNTQRQMCITKSLCNEHKEREGEVNGEENTSKMKQ